MVRKKVDVNYFRFDNSSEFNNQNVKSLFRKEGILIEYIAPYTPQQNGRIERDYRTVQESARKMLIVSGLSKKNVARSSKDRSLLVKSFNK